MATRNMGAGNSGGRDGGRGGKAKWVLLAVVVLIVAGIAYALPSLTAYGKTGTAYAARVVCSCRYIGGRSLEDCEKDLEPGMELVSLSEAKDAKRIDASMIMLATDSAELREGYGCVLMTEKQRAAIR